MPAIRNIIFDYGGVIIDLHPDKTQTAFRKLGVPDFSAQYNMLKQTPLFDLLDTGKITDTAFRQKLNFSLSTCFTDRQIDDAWNAMLGKVRKKKLELLQELKSGYRTFLLSNTNSIHIKYLTSYLLHSYGMSDLDNYFEAVYYSFRIGLRKPDPAIFQKVITEQHLLPEETLFIDDSPQHISGAKAVGLQAALFPPADDLRSFVFRQLGASTPTIQ